MARLKPISTVADWVGSNVGGSGSIMHTTTVPTQSLNNVLDHNVYLNDSGMNLWDSSRRVTHRVNDFIENMTGSANSVMVGSNIRHLSTGTDILLAEGEMVGYVMCHPQMWQGFTEGADYYEGWKPGKYETQTANPYHDRLWNGMMVEEGDELIVRHYCDDSPLESLTFEEQLKIFKTHSSIEDLEMAELYESYYLLE